MAFGLKKKNASYENESNIYKLISNIAVVGIFVSIAILVLGIAKIFKLNSFVFGLIATIAIISIACWLVLPWVKRLSDSKNKNVSLVFISLIALCAVLWIISVYMIIHIYREAKSGGETISSLVNTLKFVKVTLIISLQFLIASLIAETVMRYKNRMIVFQAITYASNLYFDFFVTFFLCCLSVTLEDGLEVSDKIKFLGNKFVIVLFVLAIIYMIISNAIIKKQEEKRVARAVHQNYNIDGDKKVEPESVVQENSAEQKLESLKNLLDKNLITQEEYDKKREEILKDM